MFTIEYPEVHAIAEELRDTVYAPGLVNSGHNFGHISRMLAMRKKFWPAIIKDEPMVDGYSFALDLAILVHDLNRSHDLRGKDARAQRKQGEFIRELFNAYVVVDEITEAVIEVVEKSHGDGEVERYTHLLQLLRDIDKADMGAVGVLRMQGVADERGYGYFRPKDFDPSVPATEGDENLGSVADDIKFCLEWWNPESPFRIRTPAIRRLVEHRFAFMRDFLAQLELEARELDLV